MRPTLRQLEYIVAVADAGRFHDAARRLAVSQPSLSIQIADAETELGVTLFERGRLGAMPTPMGEDIVARARLILRDIADLKATAREQGEQLAGAIALGVLPTVGPYLLPGVVGELHRRYPGLRLVVREERSVDLDRHLADGRFDCIVSRPEDHPTARGIRLFDEQLYVCAAPEDPLSQDRGDVALSALAGRSVLSLGAGHGLTAMIEAVVHQAGAQVDQYYEGSSLDAIRQTALMGTGVALLPSLYALREAQRDPTLVVRRLNAPIAVRTVSLLWRETSPLAQQLSRLAGPLAEEGAAILAGEVE